MLAHDDAILRDAAKIVLAKVADKRATFTRANLFAEALRELHGVRFATSADGTTKFVARDSEVFATQEPLDAEARLLDAAAAEDAPVVPAATASAIAEQPLPERTHHLSAEQTAAVIATVTSGRRVDLLVGAAGTGKSTEMAEYAPLGKPTTAPDPSSDLPPQPQPPRYSPTQSASLLRTRPSASASKTDSPNTKQKPTSMPAGWLTRIPHLPLGD